MNRGQGPPAEDRAPHREAGRGAKDEQQRAAGNRSVDTLPRPTDWPRCDVAGVYCAVLGIPQLIAAGNAKVCCRHYFETEVA